MTEQTSNSRGFTLIELLLAMGITAVVMTAITTAFRLMLEASETVDSLAESSQAGPRILNLLERDLRGLWTYDIKKNTVLRGRNMDVGSFEADRIDMLTATDAVGYVVDGTNRQHRPSVCEVGYWFRQNPKYRDMIEMWRREDPMVDDNLLTGGSFQLVCDRIKSFKITYYRSLGYEAVEEHEWDSSVDDELPRRIKIEFTIERNRGNRNFLNDSEIQDFEGAEKTYVRHFVFDHRYSDVLKAGTAMVPVLPPPPEEQAAGGGPGGAGAGPGAGAGAGPGMSITQGKGGDGGNRGGRGEQSTGKTRSTTQTGSRGDGARPTGGGSPPQLPNGFNLGDILRGGGNAGNLFGGRGGR